MSVDGVDFRINEPWPFERLWSERWYSHKFKGPALRYEVALCILTGDIVWTNGPFPAGMWSDWMIFSQGGLLDCLEKDERVEADDGYLAGDPEVVKCPARILHEEEQKKYRKRVRARQESVNKRIKQWGIMGGDHRSYRHDLLKHQLFFDVVTLITQVAIENGEPLFDTSEYSDE